MKGAADIIELDKKIRKLRKIAEEIMTEGGHIEAVKRNTKRILASTVMLELSVCDVKDLI